MSEESTTLQSNEEYVASQNQVVKARFEKTNALLEAGRNPFANGFVPRTTTKALREGFEDKNREELEALGHEDSLAGRIMAMRKFGKMAFLKLQDRGGQLQVQVMRDRLGTDEFKWFKKLDVGDIIGVRGALIRTKTEELTLRAEELVLLTKSMRPLPEKFHGLTDVETRLRQRYVDLIVNEPVKSVFVKRAKILRAMRSYLDEKCFLEVETPMMHDTPGGAVAKPFITRHNALGIDLFLRIAPELYLKRLIVGGLERVYEINRNFRNEGLSRRHNPEFTMLEFYWAYATYEDLMTLTEEMVSHVCREVTGGESVTWCEHEISFAGPWRRLRVREAVANAFEVAEEALANRETLEALAAKLPDKLSAAQLARMTDGHLLMELFDQKVESTLIQPTFLYEYPTSVSPLSRRNEENPEFVDRFEIFIAGMEIGNGFSELNDPLDQRGRFLKQLEAKAAGDDEAHPMDDDYIRALEYGMAPTAGEGIGIDRLVMLLTGSETIREVILFPQLRPEG